MRPLRILATIFTLTVLLIGVPAMAAPKKPVDRLQIPSINVDLQILVAPYQYNTWNFNRILKQAAYLDKRPLPGQGGNVVIGAHSELAKRKPGPFYYLGNVKAGDEILVTHNGVVYRYQVQSVFTVEPTDNSPIFQTDSESLTLLTCDSFNWRTQRYEKRLIVRAVPTP